MIRNSVSKQVFARYKLEEHQKADPLYVQKEIGLPTLVLNHLSYIKKNHDDLNMPWLRMSRVREDTGKLELAV